jgi:hypothetical protein
MDIIHVLHFDSCSVFMEIYIEVTWLCYVHFSKSNAVIKVDGQLNQSIYLHFERIA